MATDIMRIANPRKEHLLLHRFFDDFVRFISVAYSVVCVFLLLLFCSVFVWLVNDVFPFIWAKHHCVGIIPSFDGEKKNPAELPI